MDFGHVRNFIDITYHNDRVVRNVLETTEYTVALELFTGPRVRVRRGLFGRHDNVRDFREPFRKALFVVLEKEFLRTTDVIDLGLDEYETIDPLVQD
jgi:hypothetical protein